MATPMSKSNSFSFTFTFFLLLSILISTPSCSSSSTPTPQSHSSSSSTTTQNLHQISSSIKSFCKSTPYPNSCLNSLKLSISIHNFTSDILNFLFHTLQTAISQSEKLTNNLFSSNLVESQKGTILDCQELHQITISSLKNSVSSINSPNSQKLSDARTFLSAALSNKATCLEGLDSASGSSKPGLINSITGAYQHVSNALSVLSKPGLPNHKRRLMSGAPNWLSGKDRRILEDEEYDPDHVLTVAGDGSGNFSTISEAINYAPNNSYERVLIYVREGIYRENVEIPSWKTNIVLLGDGSENTVITGNRSVADGWTTFRSATVGKFFFFILFFCQVHIDADGMHFCGFDLNRHKFIYRMLFFGNQLDLDLHVREPHLPNNSLLISYFENLVMNQILY